MSSPISTWDCVRPRYKRNKIGLDVAIEALRDVIHERKCSTDELLAICEDLPGCKHNATVHGS